MSHLKSILTFCSLFAISVFIGSDGFAAAQKSSNQKTTSLKSQIQKTSPQATFSFQDIEGRSIQLSDYKGQWVLINFWAPWCPICMTEIPTLNKLNSFDNIAVLGIAMDYGPDSSAVLSKINSSKMTFEAHILGGSRRDLESPYRQIGPVDFFPTSYLYSPTGEIVMFIPGQIRENKIAEFIRDYQKKLVNK